MQCRSLKEACHWSEGQLDPSPSERAASPQPPQRHSSAENRILEELRGGARCRFASGHSWPTPLFMRKEVALLRDVPSVGPDTLKPDHGPYCERQVRGKTEEGCGHSSCQTQQEAAAAQL